MLKALARFSQQRCNSAEKYNAWSWNLANGGVLTTASSYGTISSGCQNEILRKMGTLGRAD